MAGLCLALGGSKKNEMGAERGDAASGEHRSGERAGAPSCESVCEKTNCVPFWLIAEKMRLHVPVRSTCTVPNQLDLDLPRQTTAGSS